MLVGFVFSDESGGKLRPALVVSSQRYHEARQEVITAAIPSNAGRLLFGDRAIGAWREAGLRFPSVVTGIVRTVKASMIHFAFSLPGAEAMERMKIGL